MKKSVLVNISLFFASMLICLLVLEFALRVILPEDMSTTWKMRIPHPVYGWSLKRDVSYHYRMATDMVEVSYNSRGYRDREHTFENPNNVPRVVVLGDSFMESFSVERHEAFHNQLEEQLIAAGREVEVINLGVGGYGTMQEYLVYLYEGRHYQPSIVLLGFYIGNDLRNNNYDLEAMVNANSIKVNSRPFLKRIDNGEAVPSTVDFEGAKQRYAQVQADKLAAGNHLVDRFATLRAVNLLLGKLGDLSSQAPLVNGEQKEINDFVGLGMHYCREPTEFTHAWEITRKLLVQLNNKVQENGAKLYIFTVTGEHEVDIVKKYPVVPSVKNGHEICLEDAPAYKRLENVVTEAGIGFINLLPYFRQSAHEGAEFFLKDQHWNPAGHALAADVVADVLLPHDHSSFLNIWEVSSNYDHTKRPLP